MTTCLAARDLKLKLQQLDPADFNCNVESSHASVDSHMARIVASNDAASEVDQMIYLFEAYKKIDNDKFQINISMLEVQWSNGTLTTPTALRAQVESHYNTLVSTKSWTHTKKPKKGKKTSNPKDGQPTALTADGDENGVAALKKKFKEKHDAWKFKRGSGPATKECKGKTWHWCTGPGHFGYHMWVAHEPGACTSTGDRGGRGRGTNPGRGNDTAGRGTGATAATTHARGLKTNVSRDAFRAHVTSSLQNANTSFGDDVSSLVDSIVNQLYSDS